jgi:hypothetical protein
MVRQAIMLTVLTVLTMTAPATTCLGQEPHRFLQTYAGEPYTGRVSVRIVRPGTPRNAGRLDSGTSTAEFSGQENGKVRLVLVGNIDKEGDAGFAVDGNVGPSGWSSLTNGVRLDIGNDGTVSGAGKAHPNLFKFDGRVTQRHIDLKVELELLEENKGGLPAGTRFLFEYRLNRKVMAAADQTKSEQTKKEQTEDGGCKRIEYRLKNVPNPFGGAMGLVRVPYCIN